MNRLPKIYYVLILSLLIVSLTGCELRRTDGEASDLEPVSEAPTLAPLGADSAELTGEATPIPTVINVQPPAAEAEALPVESEPAPAVPEVADAELVAEPTDVNGEADEAAVSAETFSPPAQETDDTEEPIIVDAPTDDLPDGGPVAADPPAALVDGSGASAGYGGSTYMVRPGDTLFGIGLNYGLSALALMEANGLTSETIYVGQQLVIPVDGMAGGYAPPTGNYAPPAYGAPADGMVGFHLVSPGETLYRIAMQYGLSVEAIAGANGIPYPYIIQIGQELIIPGQGDYFGQPPMPENGYFPPMSNDGGYYPPQWQQQPPYQQDPYQYPQGDNNYYPAPNYNGPMPGGGATHVVSPGETLFMIAQRYGLSAVELAAANGLANPDQIYVGQVLFLP
jgi:LysM repeat protein